MPAAADERQYDAFISYNHGADLEFARRLQREVERFAKPWNKTRALRLFRDETSMTATPGLWSTVQAALASARWFVVLCSPEAAQSEWVRDEVQWWLGNRSWDHILMVLTSGALVWDKAGGDFDAARSSALPPSLLGVFPEAPLWVDAHWARAAKAYESTDPRMQMARHYKKKSSRRTEQERSLRAKPTRRKEVDVEKLARVIAELAAEDPLGLAAETTTPR
jgi:hypothetical protein